MLPLLAISLLAPIALDVRFREIPNLTYQLDNAAGLLPQTGSENLRQLWDRRFLVGEEDRRYLERWRRGRQDWESAYPPRTTNANAFPIEAIGPTDEAEAKIRGVGFDAADATDYRLRVSRLASPETARELAEVVDYFQPRFRQWWDAEAKPKGQPFAEGIERWMASPPIRRALQDFAKFYDTRLPAGTTLPMVLVYRPSDIKEPSFGQQLGATALAQFLPGELPSNRLDVIMHELCHYLYRTAPPKELALLQQRFLNLGDPSAVPAYNLLNEVMATVFGNGLVAEQVSSAGRYRQLLETPKSMYDDEDIDAGAKAVLPWIRTYLSQGGTLFDPSFPRRFTASMNAALGERLTRPRVQFFRLISFYDDALGPFPPGRLPELLRCGSFSRTTTDFSAKSDFEPYTSSPHTSALFMVTPGRLDRLVEHGLLSPSQRSELPSEVGDGYSLYAFRRNLHTVTVVLVAKDAASAEAGVAKLAVMPRFQEGPFR